MDIIHVIVACMLVKIARHDERDAHLTIMYIFYLLNTSIKINHVVAQQKKSFFFFIWHFYLVYFWLIWVKQKLWLAVKDGLLPCIADRDIVKIATP